jgi:putative drug exporter of the RND superfamily
MLDRIGAFAADRAKAVLVATVLLMLGAGVLGATAFGKLKSDGGFTDPAAESSKAAELIESRFGGDADLVFLVTADADVDDPAITTAGTALTTRLTGDNRLDDVVSYFGTQAPPLRGADGRHAMIAAKLAPGEDADTVEELRTDYGGADGPVTVDVGGGSAVGPDIGGQVGKDLAIAESIATPILLALLVLVFGSVVAALLPLAVGGITILGTFAVLAVLGSVTDVSVFAINLTIGLGLGLAVDYALLTVSRFREELAEGRDTRDAVVRTVATAGRTILFSAATVAIALSALLLFPLYFLRSFAYAGIGVVVIAMVSALVVLPALLAVLGTKINSGRLPWAKRRTPTSVSAFWAKVARTAMRRPVLAGAPVVLLLVIAAIPLLRIEFGTPDDRVLPPTTETRVVGDALRDQFPGDDSRALSLVTTAPVEQSALADYATRLSEVAGVDAVNTSAGVFVDGHAAGNTPASDDQAAALAADDAQRLTVHTATDPHSAAGQDLVATVRAVPQPAGADVLVGGPAAALVDSKQAIGDQLPLAIGLIAVSTFLLLFLFSGSVLQPLRALVFNTLGLTAIMGAMVMVFQEGWFASWLGFTPMPLDLAMLVLMFCIVFGLSMDYEVFVLSRIKETADAGADPRDAVTHGLSRTGRLISMAAVLLAVSLLAFGTSGVSFIQMFGIGSGLAILVDATLIRGVLLPVGMRLLGRHAWWAPRWLRAVHNRIGLSEAPAREPANG